MTEVRAGRAVVQGEMSECEGNAIAKIHMPIAYVEIAFKTVTDAASWNLDSGVANLTQGFEYVSALNKKVPQRLRGKSLCCGIVGSTKN